MTVLQVTPDRDVGARCEAVVVAVVSGPRGAEPVGTDPDTDVVRRALRRRGATGRAGEVTVLGVLGPGPGPVIVAVGLGRPSAPVAGRAGEPPSTPRHDHETLRQAAGAAVRALAGTASVALALPLPDAASVGAAAEGALLGGYAFTRYRTVSPAGAAPPVGEVMLLARDTGPAVRDAVHRARIVASAVSLARDLVNTPPSDLHPADFAALAADTAGSVDADLHADVLDEAALRAGGFGGIAGVGQGAHHPPRLVRLRYRGAGTRRVALVGKGVTFDSGGLSLKRPAGMAQMKMDMAGAAAVLAAVRAVAALRLPIGVDAWLPLAENLPGGGAIRPSDVLTMRNGRRVEVVDTDNEGRLILADALARAAEERPHALVDVATLTSAQIIALGHRIIGVMGNDDRLRAAVLAAARRAGEPAWAMPLPEHLRPRLDSTIADLANRDPGAGGMLVAGMFLREFVPFDLPWAHLDIAGPAYHDGEPYGYTPTGGTGAAVRTLVHLIDGLTSADLS
ncbi:leucyl aminopeptidase [Plantactinospora sp. B6F1]|uniref:leucyl aminopeptidase n=1 Tax=Plantactinospora sp. B6F1 TaxID=3158971 RepID=UPI0032D8D9F6